MKNTRRYMLLILLFVSPFCYGMDFNTIPKGAINLIANTLNVADLASFRSTCKKVRDATQAQFDAKKQLSVAAHRNLEWMLSRTDFGGQIYVPPFWQQVAQGGNPFYEDKVKNTFVKCITDGKNHTAPERKKFIETFLASPLNCSVRVLMQKNKKELLRDSFQGGSSMDLYKDDFTLYLLSILEKKELLEIQNSYKDDYCFFSKIKLVNRLLAHGVKPDLNMLTFAVFADDIQCFDSMVKAYGSNDWKDEGNQGQNIFVTASCYGSPEFVQHLFGKYATAKLMCDKKDGSLSPLERIADKFSGSALIIRKTFKQRNGMYPEQAYQQEVAQKKERSQKDDEASGGWCFLQ